MRAHLSAIAAACAAASPGVACTDAPLNLGTSIVWSTDNESADFSVWSAPPGSGGTFMDSTDGLPTFTTEQAHSGRYSIKMSSVATDVSGSPDTPAGGGVYKEGLFPETAYYSAWYFLPRAYQTTTAWTIMAFKSRADAGVVSHLLDVQLQSWPDGEMTLTLYDHRPEYLASALPNPPPIVPVGQWFQIEALYRDAADPTGHLEIWLNGAMVYDVSRPTGPNPAVYFSPCSLVNAVTPSPATIYIDDIAISSVRVTPNGTLKVPQ